MDEKLRQRWYEHGWKSLVSSIFFHRIKQPMGERLLLSFYGKQRDELLNVEIFNCLKEAEILIEHWRKEYNGSRPHLTLN